MAQRGKLERKKAKVKNLKKKGHTTNGVVKNGQYETNSAAKCVGCEWLECGKRKETMKTALVLAET